MPSAIGTSKAAPALRTSAGARFTVMRWGGNSNPEFRMALRTRSRLSRTLVSGRPTIVKIGMPNDTSTSTWTAHASMPYRAAVRKDASMCLPLQDARQFMRREFSVGYQRPATVDSRFFDQGGGRRGNFWQALVGARCVNREACAGANLRVGEVVPGLDRGHVRAEHAGDRGERVAALDLINNLYAVGTRGGNGRHHFVGDQRPRIGY